MNSRTSNLYIGNPNESTDSTADSQRITAGTGSGTTAFTAFHTDTDYVVIDIQGNNAIVSFDGVAASSTHGHILVKEQGLIVLSKNAAKAAKFRGISGDSIIFADQFVD
mgnify:FL=1|tara:strand:+ start:423 stop:749 length:327 start_codon:yes stop_codon:yes gene_type:complete